MFGIKCILIIQKHFFIGLQVAGSLIKHLLWLCRSFKLENTSAEHRHFQEVLNVDVMIKIWTCLKLFSSYSVSIALLQLANDHWCGFIWNYKNGISTFLTVSAWKYKLWANWGIALVWKPKISNFALFQSLDTEWLLKYWCLISRM